MAGIPSYHKFVVDLETFKASLTVGLYEYLKQKDALVPILHISSHGSIEGIQLTNKEVLRWDKLRDLIIPLNRALRGTLILCISSCEGINACRMVFSEGEIPFHGIVAHNGLPTWSDTAIAFTSFYHLLAKGYYIEEAVEAMKVASGDNGFETIPGRFARQIYIEAIQKLQRYNMLRELSRSISKKPESPLAKALKEGEQKEVKHA